MSQLQRASTRSESKLMPTKEILIRVRHIALLGTLSIDALLVLFPRTFYERLALDDQYPSERKFIFSTSGKYTANFGTMGGDIILVSLLGLFIVFVLNVFIRKTTKLADISGHTG
jgi:hypothetical protein